MVKIGLVVKLFAGKKGYGKGLGVGTVLSQYSSRVLLIHLDGSDALLVVGVLLVALGKKEPIGSQPAVDIRVLLKESQAVCDLFTLP